MHRSVMHWNCYFEKVHSDLTLCVWQWRRDSVICLWSGGRNLVFESRLLFSVHHVIFLNKIFAPAGSGQLSLSSIQASKVSTSFGWDMTGTLLTLVSPYNRWVDPGTADKGCTQSCSPSVCMWRDGAWILGSCMMWTKELKLTSLPNAHSLQTKQK